jgi:hypothetical protein
MIEVKIKQTLAQNPESFKPEFSMINASKTTDDKTELYLYIYTFFLNHVNNFKKLTGRTSHFERQIMQVTSNWDVHEQICKLTVTRPKAKRYQELKDDVCCIYCCNFH